MFLCLLNMVHDLVECGLLHYVPFVYVKQMV